MRDRGQPVQVNERILLIADRGGIDDDRDGGVVTHLGRGLAGHGATQALRLEIQLTACGDGGGHVTGRDNSQIERRYLQVPRLTDHDFVEPVEHRRNPRERLVLLNDPNGIVRHLLASQLDMPTASCPWGPTLSTRLCRTKTQRRRRGRFSGGSPPRGSRWSSSPRLRRDHQISCKTRKAASRRDGRVDSAEINARTATSNKYPPGRTSAHPVTPGREARKATTNSVSCSNSSALTGRLTADMDEQNRPAIKASRSYSFSPGFTATGCHPYLRAVPRPRTARRPPSRNRRTRP